MKNDKKIMSMIIEDFECLKVDVDSLKEFYKGEAKRVIDKDRFNESKIMMDKCTGIEKFKLKIEELLDEFDSIIEEEIEESQEDISDEDGFVEMRNFAFTDPVQFKLFNILYDVKGNWRDVLVKVLEEMIKMDADKIKSFDKNEAFQGRTRVYFSYDPAKLTKNHRKLSNGLYVELNLSANDIVKRCRDILEQCGYSPDEIKFKVEWNREEVSEEHVTSEIQKSDNEIKLSRKYASLHVSKSLFKAVVNDIINFNSIYNMEYINPVKIKDRLKELIVSESVYSMPYHVVINIVKYLLDFKLLENAPNTKKGKYILKDRELLINWLESIC